VGLDGDGARQLTHHEEKVAFLRRSPGDDRVVYGTDRGGDERQQLFLLDTRSGQSRPLTDAPAVIHDFGAWSPDGTRIVFAANDRDEADFDIHVLELASGERGRVLRGRRQFSVPGWSPDGDRVALLEDRAYGDMWLHVLEVASGEVRLVPQPGPTIWQMVRWSQDGRHLMALTDHGGSEFLRVVRVEPESGALEEIYGTAGGDVEAWAISRDQTRLATIENDRGWSVVREGSLEGERVVIGGLPESVAADLAFSPDGERLAVSVSSPVEPPGIWLIKDGAARPVWRPQADLTFRKFDLVSWESFDGREIPGWLARPEGESPADGWPAVVWVHGGPVGHTRPNFRPEMQMLLAEGFAVLMPNVRGSAGYGRTWCESDDRGKRLDSVADLVAGRTWLAGQEGIDSRRIGVMGQSYGGFMVLSAITEYPELWRAAVDYYGIADFATMLAGTGKWRRDHRAAEYGDDPELFARISPIHRAQRIAAPLLVLHGMRDPRVPIGESEQIVAALRRLGKPVEYLVLNYAGHGFLQPEDRMRPHEAVARFFRQSLVARD
jgi:dipeptidyl aminopeptidase/acylaminoacyl peptidase